MYCVEFLKSKKWEISFLFLYLFVFLTCLCLPYFGRSSDERNRCGGSINATLLHPLNDSSVLSFFDPFENGATADFLTNLLDIALNNTNNLSPASVSGIIARQLLQNFAAAVRNEHF